MSKKNLPKHTQQHEGQYKVYLRIYGTNKTGVARANEAFLEAHDVEDTPENRDTLRKRMHRHNVIVEIESESDILRSEQKRDNDTVRLRLDALIGQGEMSDLSDKWTPKDIASLYRVRLEYQIHEAKLFGLYQEKTNEPSRETDTRTDKDSQAGNGELDPEGQVALAQRWFGQHEIDSEHDVDSEDAAEIEWLEEQLANKEETE